MNVDGCYHVPTAPGQTMCGHMDYIMWLRFVVEVQSEVIADLTRQLRLDERRVTYLRLTDGTTRAVALDQDLSADRL